MGDLGDVAETCHHLLQVVHGFLACPEPGVAREGGWQEALVDERLKPHDHWIVHCNKGKIQVHDN